MRAMLALVNFPAEPGSVELRDIPVPAISDDDVLFGVQAVSVCGSDLHRFVGKQSWKVNYPVELVHEFAGIVKQTGKNVRGFDAGDRVVGETATVIDADSLQGSFSNNRAVWERFVSMIASGKLNLDLALNRVSPLTEWREVFDDMHAGRIVKGVLRP